MDHTLSSTPLPDFLKLLAHELRWKILTLLARSDYPVAELVRFLDQPQNVVSYHLRKMRDLHLVTERRSTADERSVYYSLDLEVFRSLYVATGEAIHPALSLAQEPPLTAVGKNDSQPVRVLFLCTENSARSQIAEALLRDLSHGAVEAFSAGSIPAEQIHPLARRCIEERGIDMHQQYPKHFDTFQGQHFDAVVTVCDRVLESCPTFPGDPECIHWSFLDPAAVQEGERLHAFEQISQQLTLRVRFLLTLLARKRSTREP